MTSITVGLDDRIAIRLAERAARAGLTPEELASRALNEYLAGNDLPSPDDDEIDPFAWMGKYGNEEAQSGRIDELLAEGFGR